MRLDEIWVGLDRVGARSRSVCGKEEYSITIMMFVHSNITSIFSNQLVLNNEKVLLD